MEGFRGKVKRILDSVKGRTPTTIPHNLADWKYLPKRKLLTREPMEQTMLRRAVKDGKIREVEDYIDSVAKKISAEGGHMRPNRYIQSLYLLTGELLGRSGLSAEYRERAQTVHALIERYFPDLLREPPQPDAKS